METRIFDKIAWHLDNNNEENVLKYFSALMDFLKSHKALNGYGVEIYELGVDSSLSITSKMLTEKGNMIFSSYYDEFLKSVDFNEISDFSFLEKKWDQ